MTRRGGDEVIGVVGKVDRRGKRAPRLLSVLCTLRGVPPSEIGAGKGTLSGHFHFSAARRGIGTVLAYSLGE